MRLVPRTVVAAARLRGVQALVAVVAALVAAACLAPSAAVRWGLGAALGAALAAVLGAVYLQPRFATDLVERHEPRVLWRARTTRPVAALTIDDVPNYGASRLEEILSILREHGARATLFVMSACLAGQEKRAKFPTSKAPISAVFHSFWLIFGRAIISWNGLEAWMLFPERARAEHSC